jgi:glutamyl-tRNA synthetase
VGAPRVRFAPSPTGFFHVGSARSSLFNWLFARQTGGSYVLRIEDTDTERNREEWVDGIIDAMAWLGLSSDERTYRQSEFAADHAMAASLLYDAGVLYACDCVREQIDERMKGTGRTGYDGHCRDRGLERSDSTVLRFAVPDDGETIVHDVIRGDVAFPNDAIEDFVVVKSNGGVLFALSNLVDDRAMEITHVIRGEEHLSNTPKQLLLGAALNAVEGRNVPAPVFAHLPLLVNEQRKKLSKRRDPVAVESYRDKGFLPEAMVNFLALLGWSPKGDEEKVDRSVLIEQFRLEDVNNSPAYFDVAKLTHLNGEYIRAMTQAAFIEACQPWLKPGAGSWTPADHTVPWPADRYDDEVFGAIAPLVQERVATLGEVPQMVDFLFTEDAPMDPASFDKAIRSQPSSRSVLQGVLEATETCAWDSDALHDAVIAVGERNGLVLRKAQAPVRVAVTGRTVGPPLFESMTILGRVSVRERLESALRAID